MLVCSPFLDRLAQVASTSRVAPEDGIRGGRGGLQASPQAWRSFLNKFAQAASTSLASPCAASEPLAWSLPELLEPGGLAVWGWGKGAPRSVVENGCTPTKIKSQSRVPGALEVWAP